LRNAASELTGWEDQMQNIRREVHYEDRIVPSFAERPADLDSMFRAAVKRAPSSIAVVEGDRRVTYAELSATVDRIAGNLSRLGIARGDRVAILLGNRVAFVEISLTCTRVGAIQVPINIPTMKTVFEQLNETAASDTLKKKVQTQPTATAEVEHLAAFMKLSAGQKQDFLEKALKDSDAWKKAPDYSERNRASLKAAQRPKKTLTLKKGEIAESMKEFFPELRDEARENFAELFLGAVESKAETVAVCNSSWK
jgi:acyl-CoA synthetase (AMP-forming)/AMP-acid ligase II